MADFSWPTIFGHLYDFLRYRKILILMILTILTTRFFKRNTSIHENKKRYTDLIYIHIRWFKRINIETYGILIRRDFEIDGILRPTGFYLTGFWDRRDFIRRDFETDGILFDGILRQTGFCLTGFWARDFEPTGFRATGFWDRAVGSTRAPKKASEGFELRPKLPHICWIYMTTKKGQWRI